MLLFPSSVWLAVSNWLKNQRVVKTGDLIEPSDHNNLVDLAKFGTLPIGLAYDEYNVANGVVLVNESINEQMSGITFVTVSSDVKCYIETALPIAFAVDIPYVTYGDYQTMSAARIYNFEIEGITESGKTLFSMSITPNVVSGGTFVMPQVVLSSSYCFFSLAPNYSHFSQIWFFIPIRIRMSVGFSGATQQLVSMGHVIQSKNLQFYPPTCFKTIVDTFQKSTQELDSGMGFGFMNANWDSIQTYDDFVNAFAEANQNPEEWTITKLSLKATLEIHPCPNALVSNPAILFPMTIGVMRAYPVIGASIPP